MYVRILVYDGVRRAVDNGLSSPSICSRAVEVETKKTACSGLTEAFCFVAWNFPGIGKVYVETD